MKKILFILGIILLSVFPLFSEGNYEKQKNKIIEKFTYQGIRKIVLQDMSIYDIYLSGGSGYVEGTVEAPNSEDFKIFHAQKNSTLKISYSPPRNLQIRSNPRITLKVPREIDLEVFTSTGEIMLENCRGNLNLKTSTGGITVASAAGPLDVATSTGRMDIRDFTGDILAATNTGNLNFSDISGDITSNSGTGKNEFRNITGRLDASTTTGNISLEAYRGDFDIKTNTGSITGKKIFLTGDSFFTLITGTIELDLENELDMLDFELSTTTGSITVGDIRSKKSLNISGGSIKVKVHSNTGNIRIK